FFVLIRGPLVVSDPFVARIQLPRGPTRVQRRRGSIGRAPDARQRFALPKPFRQWRTVIRRLGFISDQPRRARLIDLADSLQGRIRSHSTAYDEVLVAWHGVSPIWRRPKDVRTDSV